jgi:hypothetical protein
MDALLRCQVSPGLFNGEVAVRGETADGTEFSLFVSDDLVEYDLPVDAACSVDGWLYADVLDRKADLLLVQLPGQTFENGRTITVRDSQVEYRPRREMV